METFNNIKTYTWRYSPVYLYIKQINKEIINLQCCCNKIDGRIT